MAGEVELKFRYDPTMKVLDQIIQHMPPNFDPKDWVYMIQLDRDKIGMSKTRQEKLQDAMDAGQELDETDLNIMAMMRLAATARSPDELENNLGAIKSLHFIPLTVKMYRLAVVEKAASGIRVPPPEFIVIEAAGEADQWGIPVVQDIEGMDAIKMLRKLQDIFQSDFGTVQSRDSKGRFGKVVLREQGVKKDVKVERAGRLVKVTANNQIRIRNKKGRVVFGPKLHGPPSESIVERADGSIWYRVKPRGKRARWKKLNPNQI